MVNLRFKIANHFYFTFAAAAYNLVRLPRLMLETG